MYLYISFVYLDQLKVAALDANSTRLPGNCVYDLMKTTFMLCTCVIQGPNSESKKKNSDRNETLADCCCFFLMSLYFFFLSEYGPWKK